MKQRARVSATRVTRPLTGAALGVLGFVLVAAPITAQNGRDDATAPGDARNCINLNEIDHTSVIDDNTILSYSHGRDVYRNDLPHSCPELKNEQRFMYRVALSQLCSNDTITVLQDAGFGFMPGPTCGLGKFSPITEDEAGELEQHSRDRERLRH
jgi:hypothetical protein